MEYHYITDVDLDASDGKLKVSVQLVDDEGNAGTAELPQREISTLLPRRILLGDGKSVSPELAETMRSTLTRLITGRAVRTWEYREIRYCGFLPWRNVTLEVSTAMHAS